jgi:hypothetical protein
MGLTWYEWLITIGFFVSMTIGGSYIFISLMDDLLPPPNIFDKTIDAIYKCFKQKNSN